MTYPPSLPSDLWGFRALSSARVEKPVLARSYAAYSCDINGKLQSLEEQALQDTSAGNIGKEVRLRYLERHRQRMGRGIVKLGYERGDRAVHRGRPVVDALLWLTGLITDRKIYPDLYG